MSKFLVIFILFILLSGCSTDSISDSTANNPSLSENNNVVTALVFFPLKHKVDLSSKIKTSADFAREYIDGSLYEMVDNTMEKYNIQTSRYTNEYLLKVHGSRQTIEMISEKFKLSWMIDNTLYLPDGKSFTQEMHSLVMHKPSEKRVNFKGYDPSSLRRMYNIPSNMKGNSGSVAIISVGRPSENDLNWYGIKNNIGYTPLSLIDSNSQVPVSEESTIVYESFRSIAPQAKVLFYVADNSLIAAFTDALNQAVSNTWAKVITTSWGVPESSLPKPMMDIWHTLIQEARMQGITFVASVGNDGTSNKNKEVNYPASDPLIISVGASKMNQSGEISAWERSQAGYSSIWQLGDSKIKNHVPDIVMNSGLPWGFKAFVGGRFRNVGGTSISSPMFAGVLVDLMASGSLKEGTDIKKTLYKIEQNDSTSFIDVTKGSSNGYSATKGYDIATGLGIPDVRKLESSLKSEN